MKYLVTIFLFLTVGLVHAESLNIGFGGFGSVSRTSISYTSESIYTLGNFEVVPEIGVVQYRDRKFNDTLNQIYITPNMRYIMGDWRAEFGIGFSWLDRRELGPKTLGTNFQFSDHIGINYQVSKHFQLGYRITHVSNADIEKPNPGIDSQQLFLNYTY